MSYEPDYPAPPPPASASGAGREDQPTVGYEENPSNGYGDSGRDREREPSRSGDYGRDSRSYGGGGRDQGRSGGYGGGGRGGQRGPVVKAEPSNCLGVFGLSLRTREADLDDEFKQFGTVESVTIVYDQKTSRSRCFGFIQMATQEEAAMCIERLNGVDLHGRNMRVDYSTTQKPHDPTPGAYMGYKGPEERGGERAYGGGGGGYSRGGYDDRSRYDERDRYGSRGGDDRRGGRDDRYEDYRYESSSYDRRDRDRYERRDRSPRRREYYDSDAHRAPRRASASPDPRDRESRRDRERDPRASGGRAAYEELPPVGDAQY